MKKRQAVGENLFPCGLFSIISPKGSLIHTIKMQLNETVGVGQA
jgi:hypothetical protein